MVKNVCIGLGNAGSMIIKALSESNNLKDVALYAIDSQTANVTLDSINRINYISIISDDKNGSGRDRERGCAMFEYHADNGTFNDMYNECNEASDPIIVISSAAGGTGSGSIVPLCKTLIEHGRQVIPYIICPALDDPEAFHLNTNDLLYELNELGEGIKSYSIFRNIKNSMNYTQINKEIVESIEIILGKKYNITNADSIDESDLDKILLTPGRFVALNVEATDIESLNKETIRKIFTGHQPAWTPEQAEEHTFVTAFSLTSLFANDDYDKAFHDVNERIINCYDNYRNVCNNDNNGKCSATMIIAGLPSPEVKLFNNEFKVAKTIGDGVSKSRRPSFMSSKNNKKSFTNKPTNTFANKKSTVNNATDDISVDNYFTNVK